MIEIQIWSDIACPFCYIGKVNLEKALNKAKIDDVKIIYRSFELNPDAPVHSGMNAYEELASKYSMSIEKAKKMTEGVAGEAAKAGIVMNFDKLIPTNTFDAHRLIHFAASKGKADEVSKLLFDAFYTKSLDLGSKDVLTGIAVQAGLDADDTRKMLDSDNFSGRVRDDENLAVKLGVRSIPFFLINDSVSISGAQPADVFADAIRSMQGKDSGAGCSDGSCSIS